MGHTFKSVKHYLYSKYALAVCTLRLNICNNLPYTQSPVCATIKRYEIDLMDFLASSTTPRNEHIGIHMMELFFRCKKKPSNSSLASSRKDNKFPLLISLSCLQFLP